jgi:ABC-type multidrug transport system fused ATPase/permease subunit
MKWLSFALVFAILSVSLQLFMPWWTMPLIAALTAFVMNVKPLPAFAVAGMIAVLSWGGYAAYLDYQNTSILSTRMGQLFGGLSPMLLIVVTATFAGLFAGLAALAGSYARRL